MPKDFDECQKNGGRIRTKTLSDGKYLHICYLAGKSYAGEVKQKMTLREARKHGNMEREGGKSW